MYIGDLKVSDIKFYRTGAKNEYPVKVDECGRYVFNWTELYDTAIECRITLSERAFVGAVTVPMTADSGVEYVEVYLDGVLSGKHNAGTGKTVGGEITVPLGAMASTVSIKFGAKLKKIILTTPVLLGAVYDENPVLWPTPKSVKMTGAKVNISKITSGESRDECAVVEFLKSRIAERCGDVLTKDGVEVTVKLGERSDFGDDRYTVKVAEDGVLLCAGSRIALMYAADTLVKLWVGDGFATAEIEDAPDKPMRGFHFGLPPREQLEFTKRLFKYVLLPLRYNQLFVEFCGAMRFDSHPEISEAWVSGNERARAGLQPPFPHAMMGANGTLLEKCEVRELLDYARELGFEIIPEVQSFGHVQYITYAHPELAEREEVDKDVNDTRTEDERPNNFYTHCYCPSKEESYALIFDLIDEIIEVARPQRYVHIGHDEVYHIGLCPLCKGKSHADLYAYHVNRLYNHIKEKGYRTAMWSDMIQPTTKYQTPAAIDMIPKDILCLDFIWYFHLGLDIEENLLDKGFSVAIGNLYSSHYPRYESRIAKPGMMGGEVSTWCVTNEYFFSKKGKLWDLMLTAEMLWRSEKYDHRLRRAYTDLITKNVQPVLRDELRGKFTPNGWDKVSFLPVGDNAEVPADVLAIAPDAVIADGVKVMIGASADRLVFKHTTVRNMPRIPWTPLLLCGNYTVTYKDGESVVVPVEYAGNVVTYKRGYAAPMEGDFYRHNGYVGTWFSDPVLEGFTANGEAMHIAGFVWENPRADVEIESVSYKSSDEDYATLVLVGIDAAKRK